MKEIESGSSSNVSDARVGTGLSIRGLARRHEVHRRTVRQALAEAVPPCRVHVARKVAAVYSLPLSLWNTTPRVGRPWPVRVATAICAAASDRAASWWC